MVTESHRSGTKAGRPRAALEPVRLRAPADLETPVSAYLKLRDPDDPAADPCFLLESVEQGRRAGRFSFIGIGRKMEWSLGGDTVEIRKRGSPVRSLRTDDPLALLEDHLLSAPVVRAESPPPPLGGLVGFLGYEVARFFDRFSVCRASSSAAPDAWFVAPEALVVFDHLTAAIEVWVLPDEPTMRARCAAERRGRSLLDRLACAAAPLPPPVRSPRGEAQPDLSDSEFERIVRQAREFVLAGDAFQVVVSRRFAGRTDADAFTVYRALRVLNPSPYLFFLDAPGVSLVGSSPESLVRLSGRRATVVPIAGTRPRGLGVEEDLALERELLRDEKERAEHVMLVDLARNDLGRVCEAGTVEVESLARIERYSHVMHLVSRVGGVLKEGVSPLDLVRAVFPAGTVTGAPKIRASEILAQLEGTPRGPYAGAVGWFGPDGDLDLCIAIRTLVHDGHRYVVQAGAGVVADSRPEAEAAETRAKARALVRAVRTAEGGLVPCT